MINAKEFWARVAISMRHANVKSLKHFCASNNIPYQTIINQKCKGSIPSTEVICIFARELGVSIDWLVTGFESDEDRRIREVINLIEKMSPKEIEEIKNLLKE
ncbi:MAG: helix-turn-helix domain containing protein [Sphaerochaetaceae bacterium]|nr:helix-turn-helix domain containing protein [Sphaerochaetaceae bacterium]